ncbi:MAG: flagellar hook-associated protein FlgK [Actinobacteria bacterium]|nr:MAG: flagellar hook-associated protein FlgK [Actinomycetota bacterium]
MASTFSGISTALSGLYAARRGLDVAGQNIANANTEGYSRQRLSLQSVGGSTVPAMYAIDPGIGNGVAVRGVDRLRSSFLEARARVEHTQNAYLTALREAYVRIEDVFAEPSDTSLQALLADFWAGWDDVANHPGDLAARSQLVQRGSVVADGLRAAYEGLNSQWRTLRTQTEAYVRDVNESAAAVAQLNQTIKRAEAAGMVVNELADERDMHLIKLAQLIGATAVWRDDGTVDVLVDGSTLVSGGSARQLEVVGAEQISDATSNPVVLRWADTKTPVTPGGALGAMSELLGEILPGFAAALDEVAAALADTVNAQHMVGYDVDGGTGRPFFTGNTASTIAVAVTEREVAVASAPGTVDGSNAAKLAELGKLTDGADALYRKLVVDLGVAALATNRRAEIQAQVTANVDAARLAEAGVNLDEEMINLLASQRAYEAAARVLTTVDSMLDTLINRTGLVGR